MLLISVPKDEGNVNKGYRDPIGIPTKCAGDTRDVVLGKTYTPAECQASLEEQLINHASGVLNCTPQIKDNVYQLAAAVNFAYNTGITGYCNSDVAKRFRSGDLRGACKAMNESDSGRPQWVYGTITVKDANGKRLTKKVILPGLVARRARNRAMCETGLTLVSFNVPDSLYQTVRLVM